MNIIETTYVMRFDVIERLRDAEIKTKMPKEFLLMLCMQCMLADYKQYIRGVQRIEYQKRLDRETNLPIFKKRVKVRFSINEYNYFQDMRKFFSRSISLCIAIAVFEYLDKVIEEIISDGGEGQILNNYSYNFYAIVEKCIENVTTFRIWWGLPENIKLLFEY